MPKLSYNEIHQALCEHEDAVYDAYVFDEELEFEASMNDWYSYQQEQENHEWLDSAYDWEYAQVCSMCDHLYEHCTCINDDPWYYC